MELIATVLFFIALLCFLYALDQRDQRIRETKRVMKMEEAIRVIRRQAYQPPTRLFDKLLKEAGVEAEPPGSGWIH